MEETDKDSPPIFERDKAWINTEAIATVCLRCGTYLVILVFALIMGRIVVRGAPVLMEEGLSFLSERPKILFGFYDSDEKYHRLTSQEFRDYQEANPDGVILAKQSANYSGGGIKSPLIGTVFLILICIVLAMSIGISAAIFLSEYSRRGPFIRIIRLAIINLAGVPSIVFGLFGFAFFCYFFPVITKQLPAERTAKAWELPTWMYPSNIADEGYRIDVAEKRPESANQKIVITKGEEGFEFSVFSSRGDIVKRVKQSEIDATKPTWVDIEKDLATIVGLRDAEGAKVFYRSPRTPEEETLISKLRPLLKLKRRLWLSFQGWEPSMIAAGCTLACMVLPIVITACEESLRAVPQGFRDASLALGATQWQAIRKAVLPYALPGMLTASVLGILRVAGETAPIMYTGAFATGDLPWVGLKEDGVWKIGEFLQRGVEAMPYHIYIVSAKIPQSDLVRPMQDGAVLVFMIIVMVLATASVILRMKIRKKLKW
ncbi:MAG: ABC transporter permease subunit [Verrucomicrobiales bacterium]|nr:ABC transporter permease subunit [Verrucomicrobiales bacterium]